MKNNQSKIVNKKSLSNSNDVNKNATVSSEYKKLPIRNNKRKSRGQSDDEDDNEEEEDFETKNEHNSPHRNYTATTIFKLNNAVIKCSDSTFISLKDKKLIRSVEDIIEECSVDAENENLVKVKDDIKKKKKHNNQLAEELQKLKTSIK